MDSEKIKDLFDALYYRMILRDFFGKVIPGLIFLATLCMCLRWEYAEYSKLIGMIKGLSFFAWLVIFGGAWLTGFGIQGLGEVTGETFIGVIRYYPKNDPNIKCYKDWLKFLEDFRKRAHREQKVEAERFVVIKEACGNGCVSLGVSFLMALFFDWVSGHITWTTVAESWRLWLPIVAVIVFLTLFLGIMHRKHFQHHCDYMKLVIERDYQKKGNDGEGDKP